MRYRGGKLGHFFYLKMIESEFLFIYHKLENQTKLSNSWNYTPHYISYSITCWIILILLTINWYFALFYFLSFKLIKNYCVFLLCYKNKHLTDENLFGQRNRMNFFFANVIFAQICQQLNLIYDKVSRIFFKSAWSNGWLISSGANMYWK